MPFHDISKLQTIILDSNSLSDVLRAFALPTHQGFYFRKLHKAIEANALDISHFNQNHTCVRKTNDEVFIKNSSYSRANLKRRILNQNLLPYKCQICNIQDWNSSEISLHLDHINGANNDHRLSNLRFLCPNCHSQTDTYGGRNIAKKSKPKYVPCPLCSNSMKRTSLKCKSCYIATATNGRKKEKKCIDCSALIQNKSIRCQSCSAQHKSNDTKALWPAPDKMQILLWEIPTTHIARKLNVSDKAVSKFCKKHNLKKPTRGYWAKMKSGGNSG